MKSIFVLIALFDGQGTTAAPLSQFQTRAECVAEIADVLDKKYATYYTALDQEVTIADAADFDCVEVRL